MNLIFKSQAEPGSNRNITTDLYRSLKQRCDAAGTNIQEVCKQAGVTRSTVQNWKIREPHTIETIRRLEQAIDEIKKNKKSRKK